MDSFFSVFRIDRLIQKNNVNVLFFKIFLFALITNWSFYNYNDYLKIQGLKKKIHGLDTYNNFRFDKTIRSHRVDECEEFINNL